MEAVEKRLTSRMYTIKGDLELRIDRVEEKVDGIVERLTGIEDRLDTIAQNGHRG